ncbi:MAG: DNA adenine methylase [Sulfurimonas sp.]|jgi:adenine-specific DNA-methyltransferase
MSYRYLGNKTKLITKLLPYIQKYTQNGDTVVDLMSGTASVSEMLRANGYKVVSCDLMTYSTHHAKVRLLSNDEPIFSTLNFNSYQSVLDYLNNLEPIEGIFFNEYSPEGQPSNGTEPRKYFTSQNAKKIDAINLQINYWTTNRLITDLENAFLRHNLVLAANKIANIAGTYGHYLSKWNKNAMMDLALRKAEFLSGYNTDHIVMQGEAELLAKDITANLCYIDPPYMKRQYAANYHIIETLARGDKPEAIGVSGLRPWRDQYSNFCSKVKIRDSFSKIFTTINCTQFLISYSEDGLLSKEELISFFSGFGEVDFFEIDYRRFKSNNSRLSKDMKEYLFYIKSK